MDGEALAARLVGEFPGHSGFTAELRQLAQGRADVELVDMERLYHGC